MTKKIPYAFSPSHYEDNVVVTKGFQINTGTGEYCTNEMKPVSLDGSKIKSFIKFTDIRDGKEMTINLSDVKSVRDIKIIDIVLANDGNENYGGKGARIRKVFIINPSDTFVILADYTANRTSPLCEAELVYSIEIEGIDNEN